MSNYIKLDGKEDRFVIGGDINFDNVLMLRCKGKELINASNSTEIIIDLRETGKIDNVGLSLLFSWLRDANQLNKKIIFKNLPDSLQKIASLCGATLLLKSH